VKNLNHISSTANFAATQDSTRGLVKFNADSVGGTGAEVPISYYLIDPNTIITTNKADISIFQISSEIIVNMQIIIR
jgi:hypothetical protein